MLMKLLLKYCIGDIYNKEVNGHLLFSLNELRHSLQVIKEFIKYS